MGDILNAREIVFSKIWLLYAQLLVRMDDLPKARRKLGYSIGKFPKNKTFREYIAIELELLEFDRCRKLYEKWIENFPDSALIWIKYFEFESLLGEVERARAILNNSIDIPIISSPEILWKTLIEFETSLENFDEVRNLYERLLERTNHPKVWIAFSKFESQNGEISKARHVYQLSTEKYAKLAEQMKKSTQPDDSEQLSHNTDRSLIIDSWMQFEIENGDEAAQNLVREKLPKRIKKRRQLFNTDGSEGGWEEYYDYIFPEDVSAKPNIKLLSMAKKWKEKSQTQGSEVSTTDNSDAPI